MDHRSRQKHPFCSAPEYAEEYDVFLSFNGRDTRKTFVDHLYHRLTDAGLSVFKDDVSLPFGEEVASSLREAMTRSKIAMPILSENYAASTSCMMELVWMLELRITRGLKVVPIFLDVTPSQVKHVKGSYREAILKHLEHINEAVIKHWVRALAEVASLKGLELDTETCGREGQFVKQIVEAVARIIMC